MTNDDKLRKALLGQRVRIYKNIRKDCFSVKHKGLVKGYLGFCDVMVLTDCKFIVSEPGRQRVLKTKQKNVHAFVEGTVKEFTDSLSYEETIPLFGMVIYNPYEYKSFVLPMHDFKPVAKADKVLICEDHIYVLDKLKT